MSDTRFETWVELGKVSVGAEVCDGGIRLHWETPDGKDGGYQLLTVYQARRFYEALKTVMEK